MQASTPYIDSHCHLDFADFDGDRAEVWRTCRERGVVAAIVPGVAPDQWPRTEKLSRELRGVYYGLGLHPWWINELREQPPVGACISDVVAQWFEQHSELLAGRKCVALGECGLDKMIATPVAQQEAFFAAQVALASECGKPLIVHCRQAHAEVLSRLRQVKPEKGGVIHAFSGSEEIARAYIALGFYIGVGGTITYPRAKKTRAAVSKLPLDNIVLETDAPAMPLRGRQGHRNSPEYIPEIARQLAELRGESAAGIAARTSANTRRLFGISPAEFDAGN